MDCKDVLKQGAERLYFTQKGGKWKAVVNTAMNLLLPWNSIQILTS